MATNSAKQSVQQRIVDEARKAFDAHLEPLDKTTNKKLIINIAPTGSFIDKTHNPHLPVTTDEVVKQVAEAYEAGAAIWHFHPRDPSTGSTFVPLDKRLRIHREWCDSVFEVAPDIITNVGGIYVVPLTVTGPIVEEDSILAENRAAPLIDELVRMGPNNRYVEIAISLCHTAALGRGTNFLSFNNETGIISDVKLLQSRGIRVEFSPFKHSDILDVKEWAIDSGIVERPFILDTLLGVHNSPSPRIGIEAFELLFTYIRMLPKSVIWQTIIGGRYWLQLTVMGIMLGADIVRIGMEDSVYRYPHSDEYIKSCGEVVRAVVDIAGHLGREVATPSEARDMLSLPQIS